MIFEPQSIIVYRNPLEQQFWESGLIFPLMVACVVAILSAIIAGKFCDKFLRWNNPYSGYIVMAACALGGIGTLYKML